MMELLLRHMAARAFHLYLMKAEMDSFVWGEPGRMQGGFLFADPIETELAFFPRSGKLASYEFHSQTQHVCELPHFI